MISSGNICNERSFRNDQKSILPLLHLPQSIVKLVLNIYNCIVCHIDPGTEANHED